MNRLLVIFAGGVAAVALAAPALAAGNVQITIRHQMRGCHAWAVGNGAYKASQTLTVARGTALKFTDNDVMPHTLIQVAGPRVALHGPRMAMIGASTTISLRTPGTYRFTTKAGEDYMPGMKTIGEDNVLRLVVVVT